MVLAGFEWRRSYRFCDSYSSNWTETSGGEAWSVEHGAYTLPGELVIYTKSLLRVVQPETIKLGHWEEPRKDRSRVLTVEPFGVLRPSLVLSDELRWSFLGIEYRDNSHRLPGAAFNLEQRSFLVPLDMITRLLAACVSVMLLFAIWKRRRFRAIDWVRKLRDEMTTVAVVLLCFVFVAGTTLWIKSWRTIYAADRLVSTVNRENEKSFLHSAIYLNRGWAYGGVATVPTAVNMSADNIWGLTWDARWSAPGSFAPEMSSAFAASDPLPAGFRVFQPAANAWPWSYRGKNVNNRGLFVPPWACAALICLAGWTGPGVYMRRIWRWRRLRYRTRHGLCLACGYDLRGLAGRCPECGRVDASTPSRDKRYIV